MKKSILNIGEVLNRAEQQQINGGNNPECWLGFCLNNGEPCSSSNDCEWEEHV